MKSTEESHRREEVGKLERLLSGKSDATAAGFLGLGKDCWRIMKTVRKWIREITVPFESY